MVKKCRKRENEGKDGIRTDSSYLNYYVTKIHSLAPALRIFRIY
jgi:hypothetical protein